MSPYTFVTYLPGCSLRQYSMATKSNAGEVQDDKMQK
jgi:hypothetical protein